MPKSSPVEHRAARPIAFTVPQLTDRRSPDRIMSHAALYRELSEGRLHAVKRGKSTLITAEELERYMASLPAWKPRSARAA
jgi:hypothetical protein